MAENVKLIGPGSKALSVPAGVKLPRAYRSSTRFVTGPDALATLTLPKKLPNELLNDTAEPGEAVIAPVDMGVPAGTSAAVN